MCKYDAKIAVDMVAKKRPFYVAFFIYITQTTNPFWQYNITQQKTDTSTQVSRYKLINYY